jgi:hypothetical protein
MTTRKGKSPKKPEGRWRYKSHSATGSFSAMASTSPTPGKKISTVAATTATSSSTAATTADQIVEENVVTAETGSNLSSSLATTTTTTTASMMEVEDDEHHISPAAAANQLGIDHWWMTADGPIFDASFDSYAKLTSKRIKEGIQRFRDLEDLGVEDVRVLILNGSYAEKNNLSDRLAFAGVRLEYVDGQILIIQVPGWQHEAATFSLLFQLKYYTDMFPPLNNGEPFTVFGNAEGRDQEFRRMRPDGLVCPSRVPAGLFGAPGTGSAIFAVEFEDKHRSGPELRRHGWRLFHEQFAMIGGIPVHPFTLRGLLLIRVYRSRANRRVLVVYYENVAPAPVPPAIHVAPIIVFREALSIGNSPVTSKALDTWRNVVPNGLPPIPGNGAAVVAPGPQLPTGALLAQVAAAPAGAPLVYEVRHYPNPGPVNLTIPAGCFWYQIPDPAIVPPAVPVFLPQPAGMGDCVINLRKVTNAFNLDV